MKHLVKNQSSILQIFACALILGACQPTSSNESVEQIPADHYFPIPFAGNSIYLQLALTESEQAQGLMHRNSLKENHGMLFIFQKAKPRAFWMKNTRIPLDLAYLDPSGTVLEVHKLYPYDERSVPSRSKNISLVLEMNQGWFNANQVHPGSRIDCQTIRTAIRARGFNPEEFSVNWNSQVSKSL